ncbi:4Fe-4S binding domain-containing protein [Eubacterium ruminantium]|nr:4Fe-4S binding domain-containing protein [Eubacterium ruminantium]
MKEKNQEIQSEMVAFVACAGCAAGKSRFSDKCTSCKEAVESGFVRGECKNGCVGAGSCVSVCKKGAIRLEYGKIVVDRELCDGCGDCAAADVCPQGLIRMIPRKATNFIPCSSTEEDEDTVRKTCGYGCIACGECERSCPRGAVSIVDNHAVIDYDKCVGCEACTVRCKKKIIVDTLHDLTKLKEKVAFVRCSGGARASAVFDEFGVENCEEAAKLDAKALGICTTGCCGQGSCIRVCRYNAITMENGTAYVDPEKCVGCRDCTYACPRHLITMVPYKGMKLVPCSSTDDYEDKLKVCDSACIGCEDCVNNCPNGAIYMESRHAVVDPNLCENCKMCQYVCMRNVIREQAVPEYIYKQHEAMAGENGREGGNE